MATTFSQTCEDGYAEIGGSCYFESDIALLEQFIQNSNGSINLILDEDNDGIIGPLELCTQAWEDGRLKLLDCNPIIIGPNYNWLDLSGEIPENLSDWDSIEVLLLPYNELEGLVPETVCDLDIDFSDQDVFDLRSNNLCPPYPECVEDYIYSQSNWGTGSCELSDCYDVGVGEVSVIEINGDNIFDPINSSGSSSYILSNIYNDGPNCSQYPGLMISADPAAGVYFPFANPYENEGEVLNWWYAIWSDATYFSAVEFQVSPFVPEGTEINFTLKAVTMGCYEDSCYEDPYCHDCPLTDPVSFSLVIGESFPNILGDGNLDGELDILDILVIINYILDFDPTEFDESLQLLYYMIDVNLDQEVNIIDVVEVVDVILNQ